VKYLLLAKKSNDKRLKTNTINKIINKQIKHLQ